MGKDDLVAVQLLRALAALSVCAVHFDSMSMMLTGHGNESVPLLPFSSGVDLFLLYPALSWSFHQSGYLEWPDRIAYSCGDDLSELHRCTG